MAEIGFLVLGGILGAIVAALWLRGRQAGQIAELQERAKNLEQRANELKGERDAQAARAGLVASLETALEKEREAAAEKLAVVQNAEKQLREAFDSLSAKALSANNQQFLTLAKEALKSFEERAKGDLEKRQQAIDQMVAPVKETLGKFDAKLNELEKARVGAYEALRTQVQGLADSQTALKTETGNLVKALRAPHVRGRWGEIQLRRVVELAGMIDHCDFREQASVTTEDGRQRPDVVIKLPGGKNIVVDAKAPLSAYLEALEAVDENTRQQKLKAHAQQIRDHLRQLGQKRYWEQFQPAPEFVVLFLPGETFFSAALEQDPALIEGGVAERVILATPTTLIALLKAVAYGWRQEALAVNAAHISELGRELHERLATMGGYFAEVGARLDKAVESYNKTVNSLETRVLVTARKFTALESAGSAEIPSAEPIEKQPRALQAPELTGTGGA